MTLLRIPEELKTYNNWVGWKWEQKKNSRGVENWTKPPYDLKSNGTLRHAETNTPATWAPFEVADEECSGFEPRFDGVGFVLPAGLGGVDFDGVIVDQKPEPFVLEILKHLGNPYCEITPSDNGLRAFFNALVLPVEKGRKFHGKKPGGDKYGAEIYFGEEPGRYLTVTGNKFSGDGIPTPPDIDLVHFLMSQIGNEKFKNLWMGEISEYGDDASSADLALISMLAHRLNNDAKRIEKYFSSSILGQRDKWTQRPDYRKRTIAKALSGKEPTKSTKGTTESQGATHAIERIGNTIKPKRLKWLWDERVPLGKITLFAGNPDNGKSLAVMSVAAICSTKRPFPNAVPNSVPSSDVLLLLGEDDLDDTAIPRLMAAGADMSKMHFIEGVERPGAGEDEIRLDLDMAAVEAKLQEWPNIRLIVIDPISNYLGDVSMVAEQDARRVLIPLKKLAAQYNVSVLIVMHLNKKSDLDAISRVGGAMAFIGVARCSWAFVRDAATEEGELKSSFSMSRLKNNLTASGVGLSYRIEARDIPLSEFETMSAPVVVWGEVINRTADEALGRRREIGRPTGSDSKLQEAIQFLETALQDGPKHRKELETDAHETSGITPRTLRRAQKQLGIKPQGQGKDWAWELPEMQATKETVASDDTAPVQSSLREVAS